MKKSEPPIIVSQEFSISKEKLWCIITELNHMRMWFFKEIPEFKAEVGFHTSFDISNGERTFPHNWTIVEIVEQSKIVFNWNYPGYQGDCNIHFTLEPKEDGCQVTLTTEVLEDFQDDIPEFKRESGLAGWNYFIKDRLPTYVSSLN